MFPFSCFAVLVVPCGLEVSLVQLQSFSLIPPTLSPYHPPTFSLPSPHFPKLKLLFNRTQHNNLDLVEREHRLYISFRPFADAQQSHWPINTKLL